KEYTGQQNQEKAYSDHNPKCPEQRQHAGHSVICSLNDLRVSRVTWIIHIALEQQSISEPLAIILKGFFHILRYLTFIAERPDFFQGVICNNTTADMTFSLQNKFINTFNRFC